MFGWFRKKFERESLRDNNIRRLFEMVYELQKGKQDKEIFVVGGKANVDGLLKALCKATDITLKIEDYYGRGK